MAEDLKKCPFCGGIGNMSREDDTHEFGAFFSIDCLECGCQGQQIYKADGILCAPLLTELTTLWNTRHTPPEGEKDE